MDKIRHLVVLMLENRSFDHMLGYLQNAGMEVDGKIEQTNFTAAGRPVVGHHLDSTRVRIRPHHDVDHVAEQVASGAMDGFVKGYNSRHSIAEIMSHYDERDLTSYDRLARQYVVCDRWFSSVPGPTWPNRFHAMCGTSDGISKNLIRIDKPTFFDLLPQGSFRYYSHDVAFLRSVEKYTSHVGSPIEKIGSFYRACRDGTLPAVSWLDPNFTVYDVDGLLNWANDDHPPADVSRGQNLVARVYNHLIASKCWPQTLFIVTYDEHGGFYDHVPPPPAKPVGRPPFDRYGVRVPAFVVSPWVPRGQPFHGVVDHTCIARTAFELFAPDKVAALTPRVAASPSLLPLLTEKQPRTDAVRLDGTAIVETAIAPILRFAPDPTKPGQEVPRRAGFHTMELTENQMEIEQLKKEAVEQGVPADRL
jgi:phospholipase C